MLQLCTDAMATLAFLQRPVFICMWCSSALCRFAQTLSSLFPARRSIRLPCSLPVLPFVEAYRVSGAVLVLSIVDTIDSRALAKQPVKCSNLPVGRPTSCLYPLGAPFM